MVLGLCVNGVGNEGDKSEKDERRERESGGVGTNRSTARSWVEVKMKLTWAVELSVGWPYANPFGHLHKCAPVQYSTACNVNGSPGHSLVQSTAGFNKG